MSGRLADKLLSSLIEAAWRSIRASELQPKMTGAGICDWEDNSIHRITSRHPVLVQLTIQLHATLLVDILNHSLKQE